MDDEILSLPNQNQALSNQPSPEQPVEPPRKKINLLGITFIIIILILFFLGILNYFNILPLSSLFPNQLGFLPYRSFEQSKQSNNVKIAPKITPATSLAQQGKETLITFLPTILNLSLLPQSSSDITLREDRGIKQSVSGTWHIKDGKAITIFTLFPNGKEVSQLLVLFPYATTSSASAEFAQSIMPKLFSITPKGKWACKTIPNIANYCENFWEEENGIRRGIAVKGYLSFSQVKKITIFFCEHSQESILYSWKSCTAEFSQTGV